VVLLGGGTTRVGDPSGKDATRQRLTEETIASNAESIRKVMGRFLTFGDGPTDALLVNNADWLGKLQHLDFLTEVGSHFSVNRMLGFESVQMRLKREQHLSFLEFNYMVLQAYDFVELSRRVPGLCLQLGGSDQWGNIVSGVDLAHKLDRKQLYGLTSPLITLADGSKMGKSVDGAVWLDPDLVSPFDYWQFWRNVDDRDVGRFLLLFTDDQVREHTGEQSTTERT
jgi:tyrosyl-tRNA synthetase